VTEAQSGNTTVIQQTRRVRFQGFAAATFAFRQNFQEFSVTEKYRVFDSKSLEMSQQEERKASYLMTWKFCLSCLTTSVSTPEPEEEIQKQFRIAYTFHTAQR
jgi:hypothetical protein